MTDISAIVTYDTSTVDPIEETVENENLVSPPYKSTTWDLFHGSAEGSSSGIWEAGTCEEKFTEETDEFCFLLEGEVRLTDQSGQSRTFKAGDSFLVPKSFTGTWENLTEVRKIYVLF